MTPPTRGEMKTSMERNLALEAVRVTEAAALAASRLMGRGDEKAADQMLSQQGSSLAATLGAGTPPPTRPLFAEVSYVSPSGWPSGDGHVKRYFKTALVQGHRKLIHDHLTGTWTYFDLAADPLETTDRWDPDDPAQRALLDQLHTWNIAHTTTWPEEMQQEADLDAEAVKRLRSLGYVH